MSLIVQIVLMFENSFKFCLFFGVISEQVELSHCFEDEALVKFA